MITEIKIPVDLILEYELSCDDYATLKIIESGHFEILDTSMIEADIDNLIGNGWMVGLESDSTTWRLTDKGLQLLNIEQDSMDDFIKRFKKLFVNTKPGIMVHEIELKRNFEWFFATYEYDQPMVLVAAVRYINNCMKDNYRYMMNIGKFIKEIDPLGTPISKLANWCMDVETTDEEDESNIYSA